MAKSIFGLSKLLAEVAMRQVLVEHPHQPQVYGQECPFCQSTNFVKYSFEKGKQRYRCRSCKRRFNERPVFKCDCTAIGQISKCQDCPQFKEVVQAAKQRMKDLTNWNVEELKNYLHSDSEHS